MIHFVDNDVILKLTACDLFDEGIACLRSQEVRVLATAKHKFKSDQAKERKKPGEQYTVNAYVKAIEIVKTLTQTYADSANPLMSINIKDLEVGDMTLICAAITEPNSCLVTGDKRCLRAIVNNPEMNDARVKLSGRVICLEQIMLKVIADQGFEVIRSKVVPARECDKVLKSAFGSGHLATEENVISTLEGYIQEVKHQCPNLLNP